MIPPEGGHGLARRWNEARSEYEAEIKSEIELKVWEEALLSRKSGTICRRRNEVQQLRINQKRGAEGGTRTPTGCPIRPSNVRVYQFHHFG